MKPPSADRHWFVIRTNPKCEEKAASNLRKAHFDVYFPRQRIERKNKRTHVKRVVERPLMLRYIFIGMPRDVKHFGFARACEGVEDFLRNNMVPLRVPFEAVEGFYLAEVDMRFDETEQARKYMAERYAEGTQHFITEGLMEGQIMMVRKLLATGDVDGIVRLFDREVKIRVKADKLAAA